MGADYLAFRPNGWRCPSPILVGQSGCAFSCDAELALPHADALFRLPSAVPRDPRVDAWFDEITDPFRVFVRPWFEQMRHCGPDVRELIHDGCPTACIGDAAFAYVGAFKGHANIGFFNGSRLVDPSALLEGTGKRMRHIKLRAGSRVDEDAVSALIIAAYHDVRQRTVCAG